jgi:hypothetical protein
VAQTKYLKLWNGQFQEGGKEQNPIKHFILSIKKTNPPTLFFVVNESIYNFDLSWSFPQIG